MQQYFQEHYEKHISELEFFINQLKYDKNQEVIFYDLEDPIAAWLDSSGGMSFSIFVHCKYGFKLHGKFPITLLLQLVFLFFLIICRERVYNLINQMFSWLYW